MDSRTIVSLVFFILLNNSAAFAECDRVLELTGRDILDRISVKDRQSKFYRDVCSDQNSDLSANYKDLQKTFGLSYSGKNEFCQNEASNLRDYNFDYLQTSKVVDRALDVYLSCKKLEKNLIAIDISIAPQHVVIDIGRSGATTGIFTGWQTSDDVECRLITPLEEFEIENNKTNPAFRSYLSETDALSYKLPVAEKISIICKREKSKKINPDGSTYFPSFNIAVLTSVGSINFPVFSSARLGEVWASEIREEQGRNQERFKKIEAALDNLQKNKLSDVKFEGQDWVSSRAGDNSLRHFECKDDSFIDILSENTMVNFNIARVRCTKLIKERK